MGVRGQFLKKRKLCLQNLTKEWKQPPVVILQQANVCNIFILCLWLRIIRRSDQGVQFMNFPSQIFLVILIMVTEQLHERKILCLLLFYMAVATYCYYEKVCRMMLTATVQYLLKTDKILINQYMTFIKDKQV